MIFGAGCGWVGGAFPGCMWVWVWVCEGGRGCWVQRVLRTSWSMPPLINVFSMCKVTRESLCVGCSVYCVLHGMYVRTTHEHKLAALCALSLSLSLSLTCSLSLSLSLSLFSCSLSHALSLSLACSLSLSLTHRAHNDTVITPNDRRHKYQDKLNPHFNHGRPLSAVSPNKKHHR